MADEVRPASCGRSEDTAADPEMVEAGVSEEGDWSETKVGTPQGAVISPLLANLYLHYALDQWVEAWRKKVARGDVIIVRYADDFVMGFQERAEAERFLEELRERLRKFGLELHPEKTRLIAFGRRPESDWRQGKGRQTRNVSTFWDSPIVVGEPGRAISRCDAKRRANECGRS